MSKEEEKNAQEDDAKNGDKEVEKTEAELAAEKRAEDAEAKAAEKEAELAALKAAPKITHDAPVTNYSLGSWSEAEWAEAEASTGKDRKAILFDLNQELRRDAKVRDAVGALQTQAAIREELQDALDNDPLSPKFRAETKKFVADIPPELMRTPENRKKWIGKAMEFGKRSVKITASSRAADPMGTTETGKGKEKPSDDLDVNEREIFESHGKTVEDYNKIKHPYLPDGIMIKEKNEAPRFGAK